MADGIIAFETQAVLTLDIQSFIQSLSDAEQKAAAFGSGLSSMKFDTSSMTNFTNGVKQLSTNLGGLNQRLGTTAKKSENLKQGTEEVKKYTDALNNLQEVSGSVEVPFSGSKKASGTYRQGSELYAQRQEVFAEMLTYGANLRTISLIDNTMTSIWHTMRNAWSISKKFLSVGIEFNRTVQLTQTQLGVVLKDEEKAARLIEQIVTRAKETPLEFQGLAEGVKLLATYGVGYDELLDTMEKLGDVSLGNQEAFNHLATAYGKVISRGRLQARELNSMIIYGWNPLDQIIAKTGESMEEVRKRMEAGGVSAQELTEALTDATSEGGKFYNGLEESSNTLHGAFAKVTDAYEQMVGKITEESSEEIVSAAQAIASAMDSFAESGVVSGLAKVVEGIAKGIGFMAENWEVFSVLIGSGVVISVLTKIGLKIAEIITQIKLLQSTYKNADLSKQGIPTPPTDGGGGTGGDTTGGGGGTTIPRAAKITTPKADITVTTANIYLNGTVTFSNAKTDIETASTSVNTTGETVVTAGEADVATNETDVHATQGTNVSTGNTTVKTGTSTTRAATSTEFSGVSNVNSAISNINLSGLASVIISAAIAIGSQLVSFLKGEKEAENAEQANGEGTNPESETNQPQKEPAQPKRNEPIYVPDEGVRIAAEAAGLALAGVSIGIGKAGSAAAGVSGGSMGGNVSIYPGGIGTSTINAAGDVTTPGGFDENQLRNIAASVGLNNPLFSSYGYKAKSVTLDKPKQSERIKFDIKQPVKITLDKKVLGEAMMSYAIEYDAQTGIPMIQIQ